MYSWELTQLLLVGDCRQGCRRIVPVSGITHKQRNGQVACMNANDFYFILAISLGGNMMGVRELSLGNDRVKDQRRD